MQQGRHFFKRLLSACAVACLLLVLLRSASTAASDRAGTLALAQNGLLYARSAASFFAPEEERPAEEIIPEQDVPQKPVEDFLYTRITDDARHVRSIGTLAASEEELEKLTALLTQYPYGISVRAMSADGSRGLSFNGSRRWFSASTIKAPYCMYLCMLLDEGEADPDELLRYTYDLYNNGAGTLQFEKAGTQYPVRELIFRALYQSDNIAYAMLNKRFGTDGYNALVEEADAPTMRLSGLWGCNPSMEDMAIMWRLLSDYIRSDSVYARLLYESMTPDENNLFGSALPDHKITQKYGHNDYDILLNAAIIHDKSGDYLLCVATGTREEEREKELLDEIVRQIHALMIRTH